MKFPLWIQKQKYNVDYFIIMSNRLDIIISKIISVWCSCDTYIPNDIMNLIMSFVMSNDGFLSKVTRSQYYERVKLKNQNKRKQIQNELKMTDKEFKQYELELNLYS